MPSIICICMFTFGGIATFFKNIYLFNNYYHFLNISGPVFNDFGYLKSSELRSKLFRLKFFILFNLLFSHLIKLNLN